MSYFICVGSCLECLIQAEQWNINPISLSVNKVGLECWESGLECWSPTYNEALESRKLDHKPQERLRAFCVYLRHHFMKLKSIFWPAGYIHIQLFVAPTT